MAYKKSNPNGQATMANSEPVVLASDQSAIPVTDNSGSLTVDNGGTFAVQAAQSGTWNVTNVSGAVSLPTGASTLAEQQTQTTSLQLIDDPIKTDDAAFTPATDKVMMIGAQCDATTPDSVDEGDAGALRMTADRSMHISIRDSAGNNRGANVDSSNRLAVVTTASGNETTTKEVVGDAAIDAATSGNPVYIGGRASTATPTAVSADNDVQSLWLTRNGAVNIADAGGSITIDGNVGVTGTVTVDGSGVTQPVSAASLPLPTGAATAANQSTIIGHVDGIEGLLTTIDADTSSLAGAVAGTEVQVDVVASLPAGTNAIGKLAANSGVDIGDVDVTSVIPGTGATNLGKAVDSASGSTDTGIANLSVVDAALTAITPVDGDYAPTRVDANGALHINMSYKLDSTNDRVGVEAVTTGGATPYKLNSAASTNATSVKGSAGQIYSIMATNTNAAVRYLKLYNKASAPTVGTDTPVQVYALPGATTGGGFSLNIPVGMIFTTGIAFATTTGAADSDTGAVAANEILVNLTYK